MAELTEEMIRAAIRTELLDVFPKKVDGAAVPGELMDAMEELVKGISKGVSVAFKKWQLEQTVTIIPPTVVADSVTHIVSGQSPAGSLQV